MQLHAWPLAFSLHVLCNVSPARLPLQRSSHRDQSRPSARHVCLDSVLWVQLPSRNIEIELTTVSSNYHVEMNPSDVGNQDRYVVQEIIKVDLHLGS